MWEKQPRYRFTLFIYVRNLARLDRRSPIADRRRRYSILETHLRQLRGKVHLRLTMYFHNERRSKPKFKSAISYRRPPVKERVFERYRYLYFIAWSRIATYFGRIVSVKKSLILRTSRILTWHSAGTNYTCKTERLRAA